MSIVDNQLKSLYEQINQEVIDKCQLENKKNSNITFDRYYLIFLKHFKEFPIKTIITTNGEIKITPKKLCIEFFNSFIYEHIINEGEKNV